jgi:hypothetical protein
VESLRPPGGLGRGHPLGQLYDRLHHPGGATPLFAGLPAAAQPHAHPFPDGHPDAHPHAHRHRDTDPDGDCHGDAHAHGESNTDGNAHGEPDADGDAHGEPDADGDADGSSAVPDTGADPLSGALSNGGAHRLSVPTTAVKGPMPR